MTRRIDRERGGRNKCMTFRFLVGWVSWWSSPNPNTLPQLGLVAHCFPICGSFAELISQSTPAIFKQLPSRYPDSFKIKILHPWKFSSSPLKIYRIPKGKWFSNHPFFRGELLNFGGVPSFENGSVPKIPRQVSFHSRQWQPYRW